MGSGRGDVVWGIGPCIRGHLEEVVGFVFEDVDVVFLVDGVEGSAAGGALCCSGWVLARGYGVEKMGLSSSSGVDVPVGQYFVEACGEEAFRIH